MAWEGCEWSGKPRAHSTRDCKGQAGTSWHKAVGMKLGSDYTALVSEAGNHLSGLSSSALSSRRRRQQLARCPVHCWACCVGPPCSGCGSPSASWWRVQLESYSWLQQSKLRELISNARLSHLWPQCQPTVPANFASGYRNVGRNCGWIIVIYPCH